MRPPVVSISLISAAILSYETLLVHLLSIIQPHHFSTLVISLAMLGLGLSGTLTTVGSGLLLRHYLTLYPLTLLLCGCSMIACFFIMQSLPLNGEELFWDISQTFIIGTALLLLVIPFFLGGAAISMTFIRFRRQSGTIYGWDLCGAGVGAIVIVAALFFIFPKNGLLLTSGLALLAAVSAMHELRPKRYRFQTAGYIFCYILLALYTFSHQLQPSQYKTLKQYLQIQGAKIIAERSSPLGLIQVIDNKKVPIRHAPGMSLTAITGPPPQLGLFLNGENFAAINKSVSNSKESSYLTHLTSALPYHIKEPGNVLLLGIGGGTNILQARHHGVTDITCVELNRQIIQLLAEDFRNYTGPLMDGVEIIIGDARGVLATTEQQYDLIQLSDVDSFLPTVSGLGGIGENFTYTVEALEEYIHHLTPEGYLSITTWVKNPPRSTLKLLATTIAALKSLEVQSPDRHIVLIRGWQTATLVIKKSPFLSHEIEKVGVFCDTQSFDIGYSFKTPRSEVNRNNVLPQPFFFQGAHELLQKEADQFISRYKFTIKAATDNSPYFNIFFKWSAVEEIVKLKAAGGAALLESGYLVLVTALSLAVLISAGLISFPLILLRGSIFKHHLRFSVTKVLPFFFLTGIAYLLVEIVFIQQCTRYLHHPLYAFSLTIAAFLVCSGAGSLLSQKACKRFSYRQIIQFAILAIVVLCGCYQVTLSEIFSTTIRFSFTAKLGLAILLIAPLALVMGMVFPMGLLSLSSCEDHGAQLIPWAWGINGCGSVVSSLVASLFAIHFGFSFVFFIAMTTYLLLLFCLPEKNLH